MCKKNQLLVQAPSLLAKSWLRFWSHYGFKNVRNVIEMALKLLFFAAKSQKPLSGRGLCPQATSVIHLTCSGLFITGPKLDNICEKKTTFGTISLFLAKFWSRFCSHSLLHIDFHAIIYVASKRSNKRCRVFFRHENKFFKIAHNFKL